MSQDPFKKLLQESTKSKLTRRVWRINIEASQVIKQFYQLLFSILLSVTFGSSAVCQSQESAEIADSGADSGSVMSASETNSSSLEPIRLQEDFRLWTPLFLQLPIHKRLKLFTEVSPRIGNDVTRMNQLLMRGQFLYELSPKVDFSVGYVYNRVYQPLRFEHRLTQELRMRHRFRQLRIGNRTRLEQRFIEGSPELSNRLRHQVRFSLPIKSTPLDAVVSEELFVNLNSAVNGPVRGIDENRLFAGIAMRIPRKTSRLEVGYLQQYINRDIQADQLNHILFLGLVGDI